MNCEQAQNLFDAYLDGELSESLETELGAHRLQCASCRHELALMEVAGHVISVNSDDEVRLSEAFTDRLLACIEPPTGDVARTRNRSWWIGGSALAAAAAIALAFTVWMAGPQGRVAGVRHTNDSPIVSKEVQHTDEDIELAADALVEQVGSTWTSRADSAQSLIELGQMTILQLLDQFSAHPDGAFDPLPDSFDELAPTDAAGVDIEDL